MVLAQPPGAGRLLGEIRFAELDAVFLMNLRGWLARPLRGRGPDEVRDVTIVLGELLTNAFRHAEPPFAIRLTAPADRAGIRVEVCDGTASPAPDWPLGRGLLIVRDICPHWGVVSRPGGKIVWAETVPEYGRARFRAG